MKINITIPIYNEEKILYSNIQKLLEYLKSSFPFEFEIVIADNASNDSSLNIAHQLASLYDPIIKVVHLTEKGRGRALKKVWLESNEDVVSYMDADLASDLNFFNSLIFSIVNEKYDLAVGSRLLKPQWIQRGYRREFISRCYNLLIKMMFKANFTDAQCGFKALNRKTVNHLIPLVIDDEWFMDTELLLLAQKHKYRIADIPIRWIDDPNSSVNIFSTALKDIQGLFRMRKEFQMHLSNQKK